ncbi:hypothetical protein [Marinifilum sp. D714]|uniref:hypothetical protein n=1 Tax=Marinifilum sp. D714 TaxID=2937523 RepID=UPI0027BE883E|nr:hypothetical protein [Marinifilum sp. D714]MDQ2177120.1 hypothetical protein [Marinifilum sp. D714]
MKRTFNHKRRPFKRDINIDDLFTGAKTPEYAVFYNIAYWWISDFLKSLYAPYMKNAQSENQSDDYSKYINKFITEEATSTLSDADYLKLRDYLWKGYLFAKNSTNINVSEKDKRMTHQMIQKLSDIRNFHSHYWHENSNLECEKEFCNWIDYLHDYALDQLQKEYPKEVDKYKEKRKSNSLFDHHDGKHFISQDGRNFFLSFFLKRGEISRFMQQRTGCKRNDKPEFKLKHLLYRYYTHRDGASKNRYSIENTAFSQLNSESQTEIVHARQLYKMISYLRDIPVEMIDTKLFPLFWNGEEVKNSEQIIEFIYHHELLSFCEFGTLSNKDGNIIQNTVAFNYTGSNYQFEIRVSALHKLLLDVIRNPKRETEFYNTLKTFSQFRDEFPEKLDQFINGLVQEDEMQEYYTFKLKAPDKTRGKLWQIIDKVSNNKSVGYKDKSELLQLIKDDAIELIYHNFYFEKDQKPRRESQFMQFAVNYLIDHKVVPEWEWLMEKFETEEVRSGENDKTQIKRVKSYSNCIPEGYRLSLSDNQVLVRLKNEPNRLFGIGETTMRNLIFAHIHDKPIENILGRIITDINQIQAAGQKQIELPYESLKLLCNKTMPRYLRLMMRDKEVLDMENMTYATQKACERIESLVTYFESIANGDVRLNKKEINTQLIRCYKYFDWKYPHNNEYKFLRQNEYQLMSIYHYTLAKPNLRVSYLNGLRRKLFTDIRTHLPNDLNTMLEDNTSLDGLLHDVLKATIGKLKKWRDDFSSMNPDVKKVCLNKLGIKTPMTPVPEANIAYNLEQMQHLPLLVHPALVMKAFNFPQVSHLFSDFREDANNSKGLIEENYQFENYLSSLYTDAEKQEIKQWKACQHKIVGKVNQLKTLDTLVWKMAQVYLKNSGSGIMKEIAELLINKTDDTFQLNQLHNTTIPVYEGKTNEGKAYRVNVKFKQLGDFMLITGKPLEKLAGQIFRRYQSKEQLTAIGIEEKEGHYQIDYSLLKQEMDRVYYESLMCTDFILQWEKKVVDAMPYGLKGGLRIECKNKDKKAYLKFRKVCKAAELPEADENELCMLRNHAMHAKIPENFSYHEKLNDDRIKNMLQITDEMLEKYQKKDAYYEALASEAIS